MGGKKKGGRDGVSKGGKRMEGVIKGEVKLRRVGKG